MYDELNLLDEESFISLEKIILQKEKIVKHNKKVKRKFFQVGDLL